MTKSLRQLAWVLVGAVGAGLGCGASPDCVAFCKDLGCRIETADCGYQGECVCYGCTEYYDALYSEEGLDVPECDDFGPEKLPESFPYGPASI